MSFRWSNSPNLPEQEQPPVLPSNAVSVEVNVVANNVNIGGSLWYVTPNVGYDIIYPANNASLNSSITSINSSITSINIAISNLANSVANGGGNADWGIIDNKGDLIVGLSDNTPGIRNIGLNWSILTSNNHEVTGMFWNASKALVSYDTAMYGVSGRSPEDGGGGGWTFFEDGDNQDDTVNFIATQNGRDLIAWSPELGIYVGLSAVDFGANNLHLVISHDGINWETYINPAVDYSYTSMIWVSELAAFFAVGAYTGGSNNNANTVFKSVNGLDWTIIGTIPTIGTPGPSVAEGYADLLWNPDRRELFAAGSYLNLSPFSAYAITANSANGQAWTARAADLPLAHANRMVRAAWSPQLNLYSAVMTSNIGPTAAPQSALAYSANGYSGWTYANTANTVSDDIFRMRGIVWSQELGIFCIPMDFFDPDNPPLGTGVIQGVLTSNNANNWSFQRFPGETNPYPSEAQTGVWQTLIWCAELGLFVLGGYGTFYWIEEYGPAPTSSILTSPDGVTWSLANNFPLFFNGAYSEPYNLLQLCWSPDLGRVVAFGTSATSDFVTGYSTPVGPWIYRQPLQAGHDEYGCIRISHGNSAISTIWCAPWVSNTHTSRVLSNMVVSNTEISVDSTTSNFWDNHDSGWGPIAWSPSVGIMVSMVSRGTNPSLPLMLKTSYDGLTWIMRPGSVSSTGKYGVVEWVEDLGVFVALGQEGLLANENNYTSANGITWTAQAISANANNSWRGFAWSSELHAGVAVSAVRSGRIAQNQRNERVMRTTNGTTWSLKVTPKNSDWNDVVWSSELGIFCAVGSNCASTGFETLGGNTAPGQRVMTSPTGNTGTWQLQTTPANADYLYAVSWSPELHLFAAVGANGWTGDGVIDELHEGTGRANARSSFFTSPDGSVWTERRSANSAIHYYDILWSGELGMFVAGGSRKGDGFALSSSVDGNTWINHSTPFCIQPSGFSQFHDIEKIIWAPELGRLVAISRTSKQNFGAAAGAGLKWTSATLSTVPISEHISESWDGHDSHQITNQIPFIYSDNPVMGYYTSWPELYNAYKKAGSPICTIGFFHVSSSDTSQFLEIPNGQWPFTQGTTWEGIRPSFGLENSGAGTTGAVAVKFLANANTHGVTTFKNLYLYSESFAGGMDLNNISGGGDGSAATSGLTFLYHTKVEGSEPNTAFFRHHLFPSSFPIGHVSAPVTGLCMDTNSTLGPYSLSLQYNQQTCKIFILGENVGIQSLAIRSQNTLNTTTTVNIFGHKWGESNVASQSLFTGRFNIIDDTRIVGTTANRPVNVANGYIYFDTTLSAPIWWLTGSWRTLSGLNTINTFSTLAVSGQSNVVADSPTDTLTLVAGTGMTITTDAAGDTITLNSTSAGNSFVTINVAGQSNVVADSPTDTLTLVAGTGIVITTDAAGDNVTITATGGSANDDYARARANGAFDKANGAAQQAFITLVVSGQSDVVADSNTDTLTLVGTTPITITTDAGTDTVTWTHAVSGVTASGYGDAATVPKVVVDARGHVTSVVNTAIAISAAAITSGTLAVARGGTGQTAITVNGSLLIGNTVSGGFDVNPIAQSAPVIVTNDKGSITVSHARSGVVAATYGSASLVPVLIVDANGHLTSVTDTAIGGLAASVITSGTLAVARGGTGQSTYTNGQILIGNTGSTGLDKSTLTATAPITSTVAQGSITLTHDVSGVAASGYGDAATVAKVVVDDKGHVTSVVNTAIAISAAAITSGTLVVGRGGTGQTAASLVNGAVLIGNTVSGGYDLNTLTEGTGIDIVNDKGSITISATGGSAIDQYARDKANGAAQQAFITLVVSGQSDIVADSNNDTLTVVGSGITITTDAGTDTLTLTHPTSGVAASGYGDAATVPKVVVDARGHVTSVTNTAIAISAAQITSGTLAVARGGTGQTAITVNGCLLIGNTVSGGFDVNPIAQSAPVIITNDKGSIILSHARSGVTAATYGSQSLVPVFVVDANGHLTSVTDTAIGGLAASVITTGTLVVARGGTGQSSYTNGQILIGNTGSTGLDKTTISQSAPVIVTNLQGSITISHARSGVVESGYGTAAQIPVFVVDANGHLTSVTNTAITGLSTDTLTSGILSVARGGTGKDATGLVNGALLIGNTVNSGFDLITIAQTAPIIVTNGKGTVTLSHASSGVTASGYGDAATVPKVVVDSAGHVTSVTNTAIAGLDAGVITTGTLVVARGGTGQSSYTNGQILIGNTGSTGLDKTTISQSAPVIVTNLQGSITVSHARSGVVAATYGSQSLVPVFVVDANGHLTSVTDTTIGGLAASAITSGVLIQAQGGTGFSGATANGQLLIGNTVSGGFDRATLTQGTGITVTNDKGSITLAASGTTVTTAFPDGTESLPSITNIGDLNTGFWFPAEDTVALSIGGTEALRVSADGYMGIGTNTPAGQFDVRANGQSTLMYITNFSGSAGVEPDPEYGFQSARGTPAVPVAILTNDIMGIIGAGGSNGTINFTYNRVWMGFWAAQDWSTVNNGTYITFSTTANNTQSTGERVRITSTGQLGIANTRPAHQLAVSGNTWIRDGVTVRGPFNNEGGPGTADQLLSSNSAGTVWVSLANTAPIRYAPATQTFSHADSGVTATGYGDAASIPVLVVNVTGHVTSVTNTAIAISAAAITSGTLAVARGGTGQSSYTNGQILIGNTGSTGLDKSTLTAGTNITIDVLQGSITINTSGLNHAQVMSRISLGF